MKTDIDTLKKSLKESYETFYESRLEAEEIQNLYHNRQYTEEELAVLAERGQPAETFNVIKMFTRQLIGYYSTTLNSAKAVPKQYEDIVTASLLNDVTSYIDRVNFYATEGDKLKLDLFLTGLAVSYQDVKPTGETDDYGRNLYEVTKVHIPSGEILLDPMSIQADYSDARYTHRFKWLTKEQIVTLFGVDKTSDMEEWYNFTEIEEADFGNDNVGGMVFGGYTHFEKYLVMHSIVVNDDNETKSIYWSGNKILTEETLPYTEIANPYTIIKLHDSNKAEYYSIFREVKESQKAINQALIQLQLMSNSDKVLVQDGAVDNLEDFKTAYSRVNAVIGVSNLGGIRVENMSGEIQHKYIIMDKALDRIQKVLGINDSFLGMAYAGDSGRKVKLQQNATIMALRYINNKLELFYRLDGWKTIKLVKQYYKANQILRVVDDAVGDRWIEINKPLVDPMTGKEVLEEVLDPITGKPLIGKYGIPIVAPVNHLDTDLEFTEVDIEVETVAYNDEDEKAQLLLETFLGGNIGQALMTVNPAGYFKASALNVRSMKSRYSQDISSILEETAKMLQPQPQRQEELGGGQLGGQSANSQSLKLPQNTNEGM